MMKSDTSSSGSHSSDACCLYPTQNAGKQYAWLVPELQHAVKEMFMKKVKNEMDDELRPEYDLRNLRVRKVGPQRTGFGSQFVQLAPDVAEVFPDAEAVNEALRLLIRVMRENKHVLSSANAGTN